MEPPWRRRRHGRERAESEAATTDVTVDPDTLRPLSRRQGRAAAAARQGGLHRDRAAPSAEEHRLPGASGRGAAGESDRDTWRGELLKKRRRSCLRPF